MDQMTNCVAQINHCSDFDNEIIDNDCGGGGDEAGINMCDASSLSTDVKASSESMKSLQICVS